MLLWQFETQRDYLGAGPQRLSDATELLAPPSVNPEGRDADVRHLRAAMYLAGYAIECVLKAYIISRVPGTTTFTDALAQRPDCGLRRIRELRGSAGHNLIRLMEATDVETAMDQEDREAWGMCATWNPQWRYCGQPLSASERRTAEEFVQAAQRLWNLIRGRV